MTYCTPSETRYRQEMREDAKRQERNRARAPRAVAVERLLTIALDNEDDLPVELRMPAPARERLEQMAAEVSWVIRQGKELTEDSHAAVISFLHEHVRDHASLMRRVTEAVGA